MYFVDYIFGDIIYMYLYSLFIKQHDSEANKKERKIANMQPQHCMHYRVYRIITRHLVSRQK